MVFYIKVNGNKIPYEVLHKNKKKKVELQYTKSLLGVKYSSISQNNLDRNMKILFIQEFFKRYERKFNCI